ncbi:MAG: hypothetical protein K2J20_02800, partial [Bacilli bacterium]|nr:hypothetical protein [Bacilli bacterium]
AMDYTFDYVINQNLDDFIKYITEKNSKENPDSTFNIYMYGYYGTKRLTIYDKNEFMVEYQKYQERVKNDPNYLQMLKDYEQ